MQTHSRPQEQVNCNSDSFGVGQRQDSLERKQCDAEIVHTTLSSSRNITDTELAPATNQRQSRYQAQSQLTAALRAVSLTPTLAQQSISPNNRRVLLAAASARGRSASTQPAHVNADFVTNISRMHQQQRRQQQRQSHVQS